MKINKEWLDSWVNTGLDAQAVADKLTMAGLEVDAVDPVATPVKKLVVGQVLSVKPHPDADKLKVCRVNVGKKQALQIVCGAANVAEGLKVPVALVGCKLPGGIEIKSAELRGVKSSGMLCSASELGLEEQSSGLLILEPGTKIGSDISDVLGLDDQVIEIDLTPNRGDCLSVRGIARELSALTGKKLKANKWSRPKTQSGKTFLVKLSARKECPRYFGRVIEDIDPNAQTPLWMQERLRRCGVRPIHPVVDVTNYVMLELGQPMHGFDLGKLDKSITVRMARKGEELTLLDGQKVKVKDKTLLICDSSGPVALAGIMGGERTAVDQDTTDVFFESAYFSADAIAGRARDYGLHTDSSHRFERGVDPALQQEAIEYATSLLIGIAGGKAGKLIKQEARTELPRRNPVPLSQSRVNDLLGLDLPGGKIESYLGRLGMQVTRKSAGQWRVRVPSYRFDIARDVDLIEEVARLHGYENLPAASIRSGGEMRPVPDGIIKDIRIKNALVDLGYLEVITYSFVDPQLQQLLVPGAQAPRLKNPISEDMGVMRTSIWPGLVSTARYNLNRQQERIRIFEMGTSFSGKGKHSTETELLAGLVTGTAEPVHWDSRSREVDFFDLKGDLEDLLEISGRAGLVEYVSTRNPALHPGQGADLRLNGKIIGSIGRLHPDIESKLDLDEAIFLFELQKNALKRQNVPEFSQISRFPAIRRDIAVVLDEVVPAQQVVDCVKNHAGELLVDLELFDEYRGEGIDSGRKSLALGLILQDSSRTLKEKAVEALMGKVMQALKQELGAELRV